MSFQYNSAANIPVTGDTVPYALAQTHWEKRVLKESTYANVFSDLMSPEKGGGMIIYNAKDLMKGGVKSTIAMRNHAIYGAKPVKGDLQAIRYADLDTSLVEDMTWSRADCFAGYERFGWCLKGRESARMAKQLQPMLESASFLAENWANWKELNIIDSQIWGMSSSISRALGKKASADAAASARGHMQKVPPSFKRIVSGEAGGFYVTGLPHPNTYFMGSAANTVLSGAAADVTYQAVLEGMGDTAAADDNTMYINTDSVKFAARFAKLHKMQKIACPGYGARWIWLIPAAAEVDVHIMLETFHKDAGPRDYSSNRIWDGVLGDYHGFLFIASEYLQGIGAMIRRNALSADGDGEAYDDGDTIGTMAISLSVLDSAETSVFPSLIVGQEALMYAQPEGMSMEDEPLDAKHRFYRYAGHTYGYQRPDMFKDSPTKIDYYSGGSANTNLISTVNASTAEVKNTSSMLVMIKAAEGRM